MTTTQVLQMALDALEVTEPTPNDRRCNPDRWEQHKAAIAAIEKALAEPDPDADWRSATGYATPAEYRADRDKGLTAELAEPKQEPVAWIPEDELPDSYPYDQMFQYSCVDGIRRFPVYAPIPEPALVAAARAVVLMTENGDLDVITDPACEAIISLRKALT